MRYNSQIIKLLKSGLLVIVFLMSASISKAQSITNVDANQEGKSIAVTYNLNEPANITLFVTQNDGKTKTLIPQAYLTGDAGKKVSPGTDKKILWRVLDQYPNQNFQGENMSFIVKGKPSMRFFTMLNAGYSFYSGLNAGLTVGQVGRFGWYIKSMSNFTIPKKYEYESNRSGLVDGSLPAYSGVASKSMAYGVAGTTIRLWIPLYINVGIGYGYLSTFWETADGRWVKYVEKSYVDPVLDLAIMGRVNSLLLSLGATLITGTSDADLHLCVGYVF